MQSGDTLTSIAHKTGVPVAEILALNPEVDPQILIAGRDAEAAMRRRRHGAALLLALLAVLPSSRRTPLRRRRQRGRPTPSRARRSSTPAPGR